MTTTATAKKRLERAVCGRCGGSGHYSYCAMYGTTCFGCDGKREVVTTRGRVAMQFLERLRGRKAKDVKPGDKVKTPWGWKTAERVGTTVQKGASLKGGVMVPYEMEMVAISGGEGNGSWRMQQAPGSTVKVALPQAELDRTLDLALAFQDTLGRNGKPLASKAQAHAALLALAPEA